jgi:hypothetical protein
MEDWGHAVKPETKEIERQRAVHYAAVSDASTKADRVAAKAKHPLHVWCPLRHQWIDTVICARMQSQTRILKKCKRCRCQHKEAPWAQALTKARRKEDPNDESLGYLATEQYRVTTFITTKKRKKK